MISEKYVSKLTNIEEITPINRKVANVEIITVNRKGNMKLKVGKTIFTMEALILKNVSHNLLSARRINNNDCKVVFNLYKRLLYYLHTKSTDPGNGSSYILDCEIVDETSFLLATNVWHKRLGHKNHAGMRLLDLPLSNEKCNICMKAESTKIPFQNQALPGTTKIGDRMHCDIGEPITSEGLNGEKYYLTIIDGHSHYTEVYHLRAKRKAKKFLVQYINRMKTIGTNVMNIRSDNGGEFNSDDFKQFCSYSSIRQLFTCSYTPQQNVTIKFVNSRLLDEELKA